MFALNNLSKTDQYLVHLHLFHSVSTEKRLMTIFKPLKLGRQKEMRCQFLKLPGNCCLYTS